MEHRPTSTDEPKRNGSWVFPVFLGIVLVATALVSRRLKQDNPGEMSAAATNWTPSPAAQGETVRLTIDFGNGASLQYQALPWKEGLTVEDLLRSAQEFRPGITFSQKGEGKMGFLTSLDGLSNEGASGRNWTFQIDAKHGQQSFSVQELTPGQHVLWKFTADQYNMGLTKPLAK